MQRQLKYQAYLSTFLLLHQENGINYEKNFTVVKQLTFLRANLIVLCFCIHLLKLIRYNKCSAEPKPLGFLEYRINSNLRHGLYFNFWGFGRNFENLKLQNFCYFCWNVVENLLNNLDLNLSNEINKNMSQKVIHMAVTQILPYVFY